MAIWKDRTTGRSHSDAPTASIPGRWSLVTDRGDLQINNQNLETGSSCYLVPDRRQNWHVTLDDGSDIRSGHFDESTLPDTTDLRALSQIAASIDHCEALAEYLTLPPLPADLDDRTKSQSIDQQIHKRYIHLIHACRKPRQQLKTELEKLPVGRAKRIPPRSLEYLASHSEDWKRKTIHGIEPTHVISEVIEDQLNIYENRVAAELVDRIASYLTQRVLELEKIKALLDDRQNFQSAFSQNATFRLAARISSLWGAIFVDSSLSRSTHDLREQLGTIKRHIVGLKQSLLYKNVPAKREIKREIHHTNIFDNDPHYFEVAELWRAWHESGESKEQDEEVIFDSWQRANENFTEFCRLLVARSLNDIGWILHTKGGSTADKRLTFRGPDNQQATLEDRSDMTISVACGDFQIRVVPLLATLARITDEVLLLDWLKEIESGFLEADTLYLYYGKSSELKNLLASNPHLGLLLDGLASQVVANHRRAWFVPVSPFEITSLEKVGRHMNSLLRGRLLNSFPPQIRAPGPLVEYIGLETSESRLHARADYWSIIKPIDLSEVHRIENLIAKLSLPGVRRNVGYISPNAIHTMMSDLQQAMDISSGMLTCPVCGLGQARFQLQGERAYVCVCRSCSADWGLRMCSSCQKTYPYLRAEDRTSSDDHFMEPGWLDRLVGRDCLAIPCFHPSATGGYVCPNCRACASNPEAGFCKACPSFSTA